MVNGCEVWVEFSGDVERALELAAAQFEPMGYRVKHRKPAELKMFHKGKWITSDPAKMRHYVTVSDDAGRLRFAFGTGMVASHWTDADAVWAQQRADGIVAAIRGES